MRIKKIFKKYLPFTRAGIQNMLSYRMDFFVYRVGDVIAGFVTYFIWKSVFASSKGSQLNGFTINQMTLYIFLSFLTIQVVYSGGTFTIGEEVKDGSIAMRLIKPINFNATYFFEEIGNKLVGVGMILPPLLGGIICYQLFHPEVISFNITNLILFVFSALLAYLVSFYFNVCYGFSAFIFKNLWGSNHMKDAIIAFMSGSLIPLAFYPGSIGQVLQYLPFASLTYTPVMIYLGRYSMERLVLVLSLQVFWIIFFVILSKIIWKTTIKHLSIQGG